MNNKRKRSIAEMIAIKRYYAEKAKQPTPKSTEKAKPLPRKFPFWARLKIGKRRTTLVIDEDVAMDKQKKILVDGYVHREATHTEKADYEEIQPNPDPSDNKPMYLKRPRKLPKRLFEPHNKELSMPDHLIRRYDKNNHKDGKKTE